MRRALATHNLTEVYRRLIAAGLNQRQISALTGQRPSEVSEIVNGRRVQAIAVLERIAAGLTIEPGWMGLAYTGGRSRSEGALDPVLEDDDMRRRRFLGAASLALFGQVVVGEPGGLPVLGRERAALVLDKTDIAWLRDTATRLRAMDLTQGGWSVHAATRGVTEQVTGALRNSPPSASLRDLQLAVADLHRVAAWTALDAGRPVYFWQHLATALDLAKLAGHPPFTVRIVDDAARAELAAGQYSAAAKLFELMTMRRPPRSVDWSHLARSYAPLSPESARRALALGASAAGHDDPGALGNAGVALLDLGDWEGAVDVYSRALPHRSGRPEVQDTSSLAIAYLRGGEVATGVKTAERALDLAEAVRSTQADQLTATLATALAEQRDSTAQDLARRARSIALLQ